LERNRHETKVFDLSLKEQEQPTWYKGNKEAVWVFHLELVITGTAFLQQE